ncbi:MAG: hypothetical protein KJ645_05200 [Planctomycetes bacterium]|nr:hypothetical protein [Planctomycetota bacterium]
MYHGKWNILLLLAFFLLSPALQAQKAKQDPKTTPESYSINEANDPKALEILEKTEKNFYSPIDFGLEDIRFIQQVGLDNSVRTFWYKKPDKILGLIGRPDRDFAKIGITDITKGKPIEVLTYTPNIVADRIVGRALGKPISSYLKYGRLEVVQSDKNGHQIRVSMNTKDKENSLWMVMDFFIDADYRLTKILELTARDNIYEEHRITLKPYKEGEKLLVFDKIDSIVRGKNQASGVSHADYFYSENGPYMLLDHIDYSIHKESQTHVEKYLDYEINKKLQDSVFIKEK